MSQTNIEYHLNEIFKGIPDSEKERFVAVLDDINKISYNEEMIIEKKKFAYKVIDISKDNIYMNNNYYKEIKLTIEKNNFINNEVIKFNIKIEDSVEYELPDGVVDDEEMAIETALEFWAERKPIITVTRLDD